MPGGGYRPNGGRPKGAKVGVRRKSCKATVTPLIETLLAGKPDWQTPLDYMLSVMNDPQADETRRDRMAIAVASFVHARVAPEVSEVNPKGVRAQREAKSKRVAVGRFETPPAPKMMN